MISGKDTRLYMRTPRIGHPAQGMDIWQDLAFMLYDTGLCAIFDLKSKQERPLALFPLGSYNPGEPSREYLNHANSCMFSKLHWQENPIPLLYAVIGTGIDGDQDGYYYRCAVENIRKLESGRYKAETLQTISYQPGQEEAFGWEKPCWGCPAFFVDSEQNALYIFSARYRTKRDCVPEGKNNAFVITRFDLPDPALGGLVRLTARDIRDQFAVESSVQFTQGGQLRDGKIYYTFGCPGAGYPNRILVFDLEKRAVIREIGDLDEAMHREEMECCAFYEGMLLCNTSAGSIFQLNEE